MSEVLKPTGEQAQEVKTGLDWSTLEKYAKNEQERKEKYKSNLMSGEYDQARGDFLSPEETLKKYEQEQIIDRPRIIKKIGRAVLDALHIFPSRLEQRRNQEAMAAAIDEFKIEQVDKILGETELKISHDVRNIMEEECENRKLEERLEKQRVEEDKQFVREMDSYRQTQGNRLGTKENDFKGFRNQRAQELFERGLNAKMDTSIEELEILSEMPGSGVSKAEITSENGNAIELINLDGYPFRFIQHAIDYKSSSYNQKDTLGNETSIQLKETPSLWNRKRDEITFGGLGSNAMSNVISVSYVNLGNDISRQKRIESACAYGWTRLQPTSVIDAKWGDMVSGNQYGNKVSIGGERLHLIDELDQPPEDGEYGPYNEIVMRRYDETGQPLKPEFIVADNKHNLDIAKKHAEYFGIPIIRINQDSYLK